jgi:SAM-dependent methyltransferase
MSASMLAGVRERVGDLTQLECIAQVDVQTIPYEDAAFDAVIANHMLYHVPEFATAMREINRVLKADGTLYATACGSDHMREFWEVLTPFVVDMRERMDQQECLERFSLENAPSRLAPWFADMQVRRHRNALVVTEVEPLVAYAQSIATGGEPVLCDERLTEYRTLVAERIRREGAYHITNNSGIAIARKG